LRACYITPFQTCIMQQGIRWISCPIKIYRTPTYKFKNKLNTGPSTSAQLTTVPTCILEAISSHSGPKTRHTMIFRPFSLPRLGKCREQRLNLTTNASYQILSNASLTTHAYNSTLHTVCSVTANIEKNIKKRTKA